MPRFVRDPNRLNYTPQQEGKEFNLRLVQRASAIFTNLMNLLPSNYISTVCGPNYTVELKAVAVELARLELALEDVNFDEDFRTTRSDFIYSLIGYMVFLNGKLPTTTFDDQEFRTFLLNVIRIYFQGSVPASIRDSVELFFTQNVTVTENFLLVRLGASGLDISDQFGFRIDISSLTGLSDVFSLDANVRLLLRIIRPAHTLFRIRYLFQDHYLPNPSQGGKILDSAHSKLSSYYYEDLRRFSRGLRDRDRLGVKVNQSIQGENHSRDFRPAPTHYRLEATLSGDSNVDGGLIFRGPLVANLIGRSSCRTPGLSNVP
jgi:hypothetical protein